jgi:hypothetical protein
MGFLDEVKVIKKASSSKAKTMKDLLTEGIQKNKDALDGKKIVGNKPNTEFKSWFKDGIMVVKVGVNNLFSDIKGIEYKKGEEKTLLKKFEDSFNKGEFDALLSAIEKNKLNNANNAKKVN